MVSPMLALFHSAAQEVLHLRVHASEVVGRPPLKVFPEFGTDPKKKGFLLCQRCPFYACSTTTAVP